MPVELPSEEPGDEELLLPEELLLLEELADEEPELLEVLELVALEEAEASPPPLDSAVASALAEASPVA